MQYSTPDLQKIGKSCPVEVDDQCPGLTRHQSTRVTYNRKPREGEINTIVYDLYAEGDLSADTVSRAKDLSSVRNGIRCTVKMKQQVSSRRLVGIEVLERRIRTQRKIH
jgi:hypothetical protein